MPTQSLADYITLTEQGGAFLLGPTMEQRFNITIPSEYASHHRVLLGYIVYPGILTARYDIDVNDVVVHNGAAVAGVDNYHVRWKVIEGDKLSVGSNSIQFRVVEGGPITFSDVVLWFQRTVTTP